MKIYEYMYSGIKTRVMLMDSVTVQDKAMMQGRLGRERLSYALELKEKGNEKGFLERLCAGYLLEDEIAARSLASGSIRYERSDSGRPFLPDIPVDFSLSHSGRFAACAVAPRGSPYSDEALSFGIDIEDKSLSRDPKRLRRIADRFFTEKEAASLPEEDDPGFINAFIKLWTKKEAAAKAADIPGAKILAKELSDYSFFTINEYGFVLTLSTLKRRF